MHDFEYPDPEPHSRPEEVYSEPDPNDDYEGWIAARSKNWQAAFRQVFGDPSCGRNRATFIDTNWVWKVPLSEHGMADNDHEAWITSGPLHAQCRIIPDEDGFPILLMEKVITQFEQEPPDWANTVDCGQVGISKITGTFVAYDFGYF